MSATVTRSSQATPDVRQAGAALGALALAVALVVAVAAGRQSTSQADTAPLGVAAPVVHDHGWSSAGTQPGQITVRGTSGGGITYTGIPYPVPANPPAGGGNGSRFAQ
jgi:hypothetical protein